MTHSHPLGPRIESQWDKKEEHVCAKQKTKLLQCLLESLLTSLAQSERDGCDDRKSLEKMLQTYSNALERFRSETA